MKQRILIVLIMISLVITACKSEPESTSTTPQVLASISFLADIAQNVAGSRLTVESLIPLDADPHSYDPTPSDAAKLEDCEVLIINGGGFEEFIQPLLDSVSGERLVIEASQGLVGRSPSPGEPVGSDHPIDPHFWLDPTLTIRYVENIRDGLTSIDPEYANQYQANAAAYIEQLNELDAWIETQIESIPIANRVLITNHESLGYFADRYGFTIAGAINPSVSSESSPSAQQLAVLIDQIQESGARAVFLEAGSSTQLAEQIARETSITVAPALFTHSLTEADGEAPTYIEMMKADATIIVSALQ